MKNQLELKAKRKSAKRRSTEQGAERKNVPPESELAKIEKVEQANIWTNILRILALLAVIGITVYIYSIRDHVKDFAALGYPGIFLITLLANATVFLPAPGVAVVFAMGSIFHPLGIALAAGTGGTLGELTGYLAGFSGQAVVEKTEIFNRIQPWVQKFGGWAILLFAAIPNPLFDMAGMAAGVSKMPLWKFLLFCWIGQIIKMAMFAYAGAYSINWFTNLFVK